jgi:hypothetical protein
MIVNPILQNRKSNRFIPCPRVVAAQDEAKSISRFHEAGPLMVAAAAAPVK